MPSPIERWLTRLCPATGPASPPRTRVLALLGVLVGLLLADSLLLWSLWSVVYG